MPATGKVHTQVCPREKCSGVNWALQLNSTYHNKPLGDLLRAAVAQLAKVGPVVFLAIEAPVLLVVLVGERRPALTAPERENKFQASRPLTDAGGP